MHLFNKILENLSVDKLRGLDSDAVKNAFFSNYLAALVLIKLGDVSGAMLIRDKSNASLNSFNSSMNGITFWGRALFYPEDPVVKNNLQYGHADILEKESGRILDSRIKKIINIVNVNPDTIDWRDLIASLVIMKHRFTLKSSYFNKLVYGLSRWESLNPISKQSLIGTAYLYLNQSDASSNLLGYFRSLNSSSMLTSLRAVFQKVTNLGRLAEDEGISTANISTSDQISDNAIITREQDSPINTLAIWKPLEINKKQSTKKTPGSNIRARKFKLIKFKRPT